MKEKSAILSSILFCMLALTGLLFAGLWLAATISVCGADAMPPVKYGISAFFVWLVFEMLWRSGAGWYRRHELLVVALFFFLLYLATLKIMPELGQLIMPYDAMRAQKSLEAGHIAFFRSFRFYYWINYDFLLSTLGMIFEPRLIVGQVANAVCRAAALYPIFKLGERVAGRRMALFSTVVIALSPALTIYASILVGDFIASLFYLYAVYALLTPTDATASERCEYARLIFVGLLAGIGCLFKTVSFLLWGALMVLALFRLLGRPSAKTALLLGLSLFVIWLSHSAVLSIRTSTFNTLVTSEADRKANEASFIDGILYETYLGLSIPTRGRYAPHRDRAIRHAKRVDKVWMVKDMLKKDLPNYPKFMVEKFCSVWGGNHTDGSIFEWFRISCQKDCYNLRDKNYCVKWLPSLLRAEHVFFVTFFLLGAAGLLMARRRTLDFLAPGIIAMTIVLAYAAMSMVIEGYGRYKTVIYPCIALILPYARIWLEKDSPAYALCLRIAKRDIKPGQLQEAAKAPQGETR